MSGSRRRRGSSSRRYKTPDLVPIQPRRPRRIGTAEIVACVGVSVVAALLIALIWVVLGRTVDEQRADIRDRAERAVTAQAATLAEEIRHEMLQVDQTLVTLRTAWNRDPDTFRLTDWQRQLPALMDVSSDIFVADDNWVVRQSTIPTAVGMKVGGAYVNFPAGSLEVFAGDGARPQEGRLIVGDSGQTVEARRYLMYIVQGLEKPAKWKIGAAYRSDGLTRLFAEANLGINGTTALLDTQRGTLQAIVGPSARKPKTDIADSDMFRFIQNKRETASWTGVTPMDDVARIHGISRVAGRDMAVVVAITEVEALAPAASLTGASRLVASTASGVVIAIGVLVLWELFTLRANRRRQRNFARGQAELESARTEMVTMRNRAALHGAQVQALLRGSPDGVAILDTELRLVAWNALFATGCGVAPEILREGLPIDELMRQQAREGWFGILGTGENDEIEIEVARRVAILRTEPAGAVLPQYGPNGQEIALHVEPVADGGGLTLILGGLRDWQPSGQGGSEPAPVVQTEAPAPVYTTIEW